MNKIFYLNAIALILMGLFSSSCEKDEVDAYVDNNSSGDSLTVDTTVVVGTDTTTIDTTVVVTDGYIDSLWNVWETNGGARLNNLGMGDINFLVSSSGELDSLTFGNHHINDYFVEDGSFEYIGDGKFVFKYDQLVWDVHEPFIDTVIMYIEPVYPDYIALKWKNFQKLIYNPVPPSTYYYTIVN